jgi:hypothetical protein
MRLASTTSNGPDPPSDAIAPGVRRGCRDRDGVGVDAERAHRAELHRGNREDSGAAADVEHARAGQPPGLGQRLDAGQAQTRRRVQTRPERHAGIEREDDVTGGGPMTPPCRADDDPAAHAHDREVGLPGIGPVGFLDDARPHVGDRPETERLKMAQCDRDLIGGSLCRIGIAGGQVRPDGGRSARVDSRPEPFVDELECRLDGRPAGRHPTEDLAHRLDGLGVGLDGELQPTAATVCGFGQPSPSFSRSPPPPCPTDSPVSSA